MTLFTVPAAHPTVGPTVGVMGAFLPSATSVAVFCPVTNRGRLCFPCVPSKIVPGVFSSEKSTGESVSTGRCRKELWRPVVALCLLDEVAPWDRRFLCNREASGSADARGAAGTAVDHRSVGGRGLVKSDDGDESPLDPSAA